jgi:putative Mn2+ efflux pump MntP
MMPVLALAISLSLDNARVVMALAAAGLTRRVATRMIAAFVVLESLMPVGGLLIGTALRTRMEGLTEWAGIVALVSAGVYLLGTTLIGQSERTPDKAWMVLGLPLALSLDNLIAGLGLGLLDVSVVMVGGLFGLATALTCSAGFLLGHRALSLSPRLARVAAGVALVGFALWR